MTTPHTDAEVLSDAIEILEGENSWCQGAYFRFARNTMEKIAFCAEGAIRQAAGFWDVVEGTRDIEDPTLTVGISYGDLGKPEGILIHDQCLKLEQAVFQHHEGRRHPHNIYSLNQFNDDKHTSKSDVLLAMKKALNEVEGI